jgi:uncharacterized protein
MSGRYGAANSRKRGWEIGVTALLLLSLAVWACGFLAWRQRTERQNRLDVQMAKLLSEGLHSQWGISNSFDVLILTHEDAAAAHELLKQGASVHVRGRSGMTILMMAAWYGDPAFVEDALARDAEVDAREEPPGGEPVPGLAKEPVNYWCGTTALIGARTTAIAQRLLAAGADVNLGDNGNYTALMAAARKGRMEQMKILLAAGADPHARTNDGYTALMAAARAGNVEGVEILLAAGTDVHEKTCWGRSALMWAARGGSERIVKLLLARGADVDVRDEGGDTALMWAKVQGGPGVVRLLRRAGAKK